MTEDKNKQEQTPQSTDNKNEEQLPVHNPFNANDDKKITSEDVENEQVFKEAQTERD